MAVTVHAEVSVLDETLYLEHFSTRHPLNNDIDDNFSRPLFENMPSLSEEAASDSLEMMHWLIDAYEEHYAETLQ